MRIVYYFNPDEKLQERVSAILKVYKEYDLINVYNDTFAGIKTKYGLPDNPEPHLLSINNGQLEGLWNLTNEY